MFDKVPARAHSGNAWVVRPEGRGPVAAPAAGAPKFNPSKVVLLTMEALGHHGINTEVGSANMGAVMSAAADLLRALGVQPASARRPGHMGGIQW